MKCNLSKRILSAVLAVIIITMSAPLVFAEQQVLTVNNVVEWPTVEYKNTDGLYYYEQPIDDGLVLNGGVVTTDGTATGTVIAGKFVFNYEEDDFPSSGTRKANIKFIPEDLITYSGFEVDSSTEVTFVVTKATPVFEDEINNPLIATEVEAGATLANSTLSGGKVVNPYNANAPKLATKSWSWSDKKTVVTESGYYEAKLTCPSYNTIYAQVYVKVAGDATPTKITEISSMNLIYDTNRTWENVEIVGAKAVEEGTDTEVAGTFAITGKTGIVKVGTHEVTITFTPTDTNKYNSSAKTITIKVEKSPICFTDNIGNKIVPELTMPYGTKLNSDFANTLAKYVNIGENVWIYYRDIDGNEYDYSGTTPGLGTHTYKVTAIPYNPSTSNYKATELEFKLTIEPFEVTPNLTARGNDKYMITTGDYKISPRGSYDLYVDGELAIEDIKYQEEFTWRPEKSGTYDLKAVYNPVENDTYKVNDAVREDYVKNLTWEINCTNCTARAYAYGEKAMVSHMLGDQFAGWVFYDENGNEFTPENIEEYSSYVYFTMPDFSPTVRAKIVGEADDSVDNDDNSGSGNIGSTSIFGRFIEFLRNLFEKYINIFKTIFGMFAPAN